MQSFIQFFNDAGWLANLVGIASFFGVCCLVFFRWIRPHFRPHRIDKEIPAGFEQKWDTSRAKEIAKIAIVDDQLSDFPTVELKADGYQVQTYRQVTLSKTDQLATYDIVFLDMKGVVKDDYEDGGLKLIAELR